MIDDAAVMMLAEVAPSRFLSTLRLGRVTDFADEVRTPNARTVSYQGVVAVIVLIVPMVCSGEGLGPEGRVDRPESVLYLTTQFVVSFPPP